MSSHKEQHSATGREKAKETSKATKEPDKPADHRVMTESEIDVSEVAIDESRLREQEGLLKSLQEEKNKAEQYLTSLKYLRAEFENYQKRTAKEMNELVQRGSERLARKLLGVIDDFERTINASKTVGDQSKLLSGAEMILKELIKILKSEGIARIEAVGKKFDPTLHEAVMVSRTDKYAPGTVVEELRSGYMFDGRVIRPSMVTVSNSPDTQTGPADSEKKGESEREESDV